MDRTAKIYLRDMAIASAAYAVVLIVCISLLSQMPASPLRYAVAALPMLPILYGVRSYLRALARLDELQQRIHGQALAIAAGGTGLICATWGFLELAGLPPLPTIWVFPITIWLWGLGLAYATRRLA